MMQLLMIIFTLSLVLMLLKDDDDALYKVQLSLLPCVRLLLLLMLPA